MLRSLTLRMTMWIALVAAALLSTAVLLFRTLKLSDYDDTSKRHSVVRKPNIVIILADDLGYGDLSFFGHPTSSTPYIDNMASKGLVFTQFYSTSPVCSPSRYESIFNEINFVSVNKVKFYYRL